jgi:hypothetical protein
MKPQKEYIIGFIAGVWPALFHLFDPFKIELQQFFSHFEWTSFRGAFP